MNEQEELERARLHFENNLADVVRIADLECQLAEAQGKLEAMREWYAKFGAWGPLLIPAFDRILRGTEGEE